MKTLHIQKVKQIAGSETYLLKILPALIKEGVDCEFVCVYEAAHKEAVQPYLDMWEELGIICHAIEINRLIEFQLLRRLKKIIKQGDFTLVHTHLIHADFWCALVKLFFFQSFHLVSTKHGYSESYTNKNGFDAKHLKRDVYFYLSQFSESFIQRSFTVSKGLQRFFIETGIARRGMIDVVYHGFDYPAVDKVLISTYKKSTHQLFIAGRLVGFKGHRFALEALQLVKEKTDDVCLYIAGWGPEEDKLKEQIVKLGLEEHVVLLGYQNDINEWMAASDIILVPSISEGFGLIFLEAFNAETPVIAFNVPASNELIEHDETGYLIEPYDIVALADKINSILSDKGSTSTITANAKAKLDQYYSLDRMVEDTISFYKRSLKTIRSVKTVS